MLRFASEPACPSELLSLDKLRPFVLEKDEWFRTDSGTSYRLSKSSPPCPAERLTNTAYNSTRIRKECLTVNTLFVISTTILSERISLYALIGCGENRLTLSHRATIRREAAKAFALEKTRQANFEKRSQALKTRAGGACRDSARSVPPAVFSRGRSRRHGGFGRSGLCRAASASYR